MYYGKLYVRYLPTFHLILQCCEMYIIKLSKCKKIKTQIIVLSHADSYFQVSCFSDCGCPLQYTSTYCLESEVGLFSLLLKCGKNTEDLQPEKPEDRAQLWNTV